MANRNFLRLVEKISQHLPSLLQESARCLGAVTFWTDYLSASGDLFLPKTQTKTLREIDETT
jgi:hypothetical protein